MSKRSDTSLRREMFKLCKDLRAETKKFRTSIKGKGNLLTTEKLSSYLNVLNSVVTQLAGKVGEVEALATKVEEAPAIEETAKSE
jgi:hypothetical protein